MWWGGSSAPARFLVPILPLLAPMIAVAFAARARGGARRVAGSCSASAWRSPHSASCAPQRFMLFSAPHGLSNLVDAVQGGAPLTSLLPAFTEDHVRASLGLLMPWLIAGLVAAIVVAVLSRLAGARIAFASACAGLAIFAIGGAVLAGAPASAEQRRAIALRGRQISLGAIDSSLRGLDYTRQVRLNARQAAALGALTVSRAAGQLSDGPRHLAGPFTLPPGRFTAHLVFAEAQPRHGTTMVVMGDAVLLAVTDAGGGIPLPFQVLLLKHRSGLTFRIAHSQQRSSRWKSCPRMSCPAASRPGIVAHRADAIPHRAGAFIVYADDDSYPEGGEFWTRGTSAATVAIGPNGASMLTLTLHVGPTAGRVRVRVDGVDRSLTLEGGQTQQLEVPLASDARLVRVEIQAPGAFRPSDHEPGSNDRRWLGVHVGVGLR